MLLRPACGRLLLSALTLALAACATTRMAAEWKNKDYLGGSLKGQRILVVCQAPDATVQRLCEDQLVTTANSWGLVAVQPDRRAADTPGSAPLPGDAYRELARAMDAATIMSMTIAADSTVVSPGPMIGIGVGGGSFGGGGWGRGGGSFGGVGTSVGFPVGAGSVQQGFAASTTVLDTTSGQPIWSGRAVAPPSNAFPRQLMDLTRVTFESMQKAGVL
jgi:hypothetical protein